MVNINVDLPKELENQLNYLEIVSKRTKSFFFREALTRYLEDMKDLYVSLERLERGGKTYTSDEVKQRLNFK